MLFNSFELQTTAGYSDKRHFLKDCSRYNLPITPHRRVMGENRYSLGHIGLALVIAELQSYEIALPTCKRLIDRIDIEFFDDQVDLLQAGKINALIVMIPSRHDLDREDFPTVATSWDEVIRFARDEAINFFPIEIGEMLREKLKGNW